MTKKTYVVGILSLSAMMLFVANFLVPSNSSATDISMKDRDYSAVTAHEQTGDDALYVMDNRSGMMLVFTYDPTRKSMVMRDRRSVLTAFGNVGR